MALITDTGCITRPAVKNKRNRDETDIQQENEKEEDDDNDEDEETPKKRKKSDKPKVRDLIQAQRDAIPKAREDMEVSVTLESRILVPHVV
jgi:hypothetical protein